MDLREYLQDVEYIKPPMEQFWDFMDKYAPNREPQRMAIIPGEFMRFEDTTKGESNSDISALYNERGKSAFFFVELFRTGQTFKGFAKYDGTLSIEQEEAIKRDNQAMQSEAKAKKEKQQQEVAAEVRKEWAKLPDASADNEYLAYKHVGAYGVKQQGKALVVPLFNSQGELMNYQVIYKLGDKFIKKYKKDGRVKGLFLVIGKGEPFYIVEGYATGCSVYEATGKTVVVSFSAGNLINIARYFPKAVVVADNDESLTGIKEAMATGLPVKLIPEVGMDANDFAVKYGLEALKNFLDREEKPGFQEGFKTMAELMAEPDEEDSYLIDNRVSKGYSVDYLAGVSGCGKTFVVTDWALSIAYGLEAWNGYRTVPGKVVYFCGESWKKYKKRLWAWKKEHGIDEDSQNFIVYCGSKRKFNERGMVAYIKSELVKLNFTPDLIIVDHQQKYTMGDENDGKTAKDIVDKFFEVAEMYNCNVLVVHHFGKDASKKLKGNSVYGDEAIVIHTIDKTKQDGVFKLYNEKPKDEERQKDLYYFLKQIPLYVDKHGKTITSCVPKYIDKGKQSAEEKETDVKNKKQHEADIKVLKDFILKGKGVSIENGELTFTRSALVSFLLNYWECTEKKAKDNANPNIKGLISRLVEADTLQDPEELPKKNRELQDYKFVVCSFPGDQFIADLEAKRSKEQQELMSL